MEGETDQKVDVVADERELDRPPNTTGAKDGRSAPNHTGSRWLAGITERDAAESVDGRAEYGNQLDEL